MQKIIMDEEMMRRTVVRMAHELCEQHPILEKVVCVGIVKRGDLLAKRITQTIKKSEGIDLPVGSLDISFYRDDDRVKTNWEVGPHPSHLPFSVDDKQVILVDDVLYTGRSIRAAMDELIDYGRPLNIRLAVLIDRGHRELPIHADIVGKKVPTSINESVHVRFKEMDDQNLVYIEKQE